VRAANCVYALPALGANMLAGMEDEQRNLLYEALANDISAMIQSGTLAAGERVPSVRRLSRQRRVSVSLRRTYARQVQLMTSAIGRHFPPGTSVTRPTAGYVLWVELPAAVDSIELYERALRERISLAPGSMFSPRGRYRNCLRVNCGIAWTDEAQHQVRRVGELACELAGATGAKTRRQGSAHASLIDR
jgi:DNA-binding transcriptional MocR family regulator